MAAERPFLLGRSRAANGRERAGVETQSVTDIIEAQGMGEVGVEQAHDMTPGVKLRDFSATPMSRASCGTR